MPACSRRGFLNTLGAGALASALPRLGRAEPVRRPNIVFILADDLGWMDTTVYGSRYYRTPHLDRLAARSMRFTNAYAANPLCSPTRASILTGQYPGRLQITTPGGHLPSFPDDQPMQPTEAAPHVPLLMPGSRRHLRPDTITLAEVLRDAGYRTGFFGKWHLGLEPEYWPEQQGFEVAFHGAPDPGPRSYFSPYRFPAGTVTDGPEGEYIVDRLADEAERYLHARAADRDAGRDEPFLMCFWQYAVHAPYQAKPAYIDEAGEWVAPDWPQTNPIMAGMIRSLDDSVGRLVDTLDRLGQTDDTLMVFFSDNGGNMYDRTGEAQLPPTDNAPLRSGKGSVYEGGVRVPMMVAWPGRVAPNTVSDALVSSIDFYPTLLDAVGVTPPPEQVVDGISLLPVWTGRGELDREAIFCHMPHVVGAPTGRLTEPATWVRRGDWKLIRFYQTSATFPNAHELYHLAEDIGERHNLAAERPALVRELDALIDGFLATTGSLYPRPNPRHDPNALADVDGWAPSGDAGVYRDLGLLRVAATGNDPFISTALHEGVNAGGELVIRFRLRAEASGSGQFFWTDAEHRNFGPTARLDFEPVHDGQWHEYAVPFTAGGRVTNLRLDPAAGPGTLWFDWIRLERADGTVVEAWYF